MYTCICTAEGEENCPAQGKEAHPSQLSQGIAVDEGGSQERKTGQVCLQLFLILATLCLVLFVLQSLALKQTANNLTGRLEIFWPARLNTYSIKGTPSPNSSLWMIHCLSPEIMVL